MNTYSHVRVQSWVRPHDKANEFSIICVGNLLFTCFSTRFNSSTVYWSGPELPLAFASHSQKSAPREGAARKAQSGKSSSRLNFEKVSQHSESGTPSKKKDLKKRLGSGQVRNITESPEPRRSHSKSPRKKDSERKTVFKMLEKGVFYRLGDKGKSMSSYSNDSRCGHTTVAAVTPKAATRRCQKVVWEDTGSQNQSGRSQALRMICLNRGAKQRITQTFSPESVISFPPLGAENGTEGPMIIEAEMGGHFVHRMYVDGGSSLEILYEHCFNRFCPEVRSQMVPATIPLVSKVTIPIQRNHRKDMSKENPGSSVYSSQNDKIPSDRLNGRITEQHDYSIRMNNGFKTRSAVTRNQPSHRRKNPADSNGVPRHIKEHMLNIREGCLPVRQKKRGQAPKINKAIYEKVEKLVDAGNIKEIHYHSWLSNPVMVKKHDGRAKAKWEVGKPQQILTAKVETAFKQMKKLIAELPMLTTPKEKEELVIYLVAAKKAISAVLMTKKDGKQMPIYFVSRALQGPKINYTLIEKLILALVKNLTSTFKEFSIKQVPRGENKKADALSKMASTSFAHLSKQVLVEELKEKSIDEKEVLAVVEEEGRTWMTPIYEYLTEEILPKEKRKARAIRRKAVIIVEIGMPTLRTAEVNLIKNNKGLEINLYLLEEKREQAAIQEAKSKDMMENTIMPGFATQVSSQETSSTRAIKQAMRKMEASSDLSGKGHMRSRQY
nr:reverse transcriptase domain-containing protein [Tanacetum cinerariifolium]